LVQIEGSIHNHNLARKFAASTLAALARE